MMSDIDKGFISTVIVKDLSRFGRTYLEVGRLIEEFFSEKGIRFISVGEDADSAKENFDLDLMIPMKNIFNQFYPADCSRKTRQALKHKALKGEFIGSKQTITRRQTVQSNYCGNRRCFYCLVD